MKIPISTQIEAARRWRDSATGGPDQDAAEAALLSLEFLRVYRDDFYAFMERGRLTQPQ